MDNALRQLLPALSDARAKGESLVLATLLAKQGSTYRKPGAQVLFRQDGSYAGLLSGGCVESDLALHAARVFRSGRPVLVRWLARPDGSIVTTVTGTCRGRIGHARRGTGGFGYDPLFVPEGEARTMAELPPEEKDARSHRGGAAFRAIRPALARLASLDEVGSKR